MSAVPRWFDRRFEEGLAVEMHPNVRARLATVAGRVAEVVRDLPHEALVQRVGDKWSIQEHAGHLLDLEDLFGVRIGEFLAGVETLSPADLTNRKTEEARHNEGDLRDIVAALRAVRGRMMERLDPLEAADFARVARHPRLGTSMRLLDFMSFVAEHDDHHLAVMRELRARLA